MACDVVHPTQRWNRCERPAEHDLEPGSFHRRSYGPTDETVPGVRTGHTGYRSTHVVIWPGSVPAIPELYDDPPLEELT